ncbi:P-loop containing nucleoside triphosphate hydrolase protein [Auricularia subglabra TFB-10046 SS5]|uniref:DNA 3'-5' helicase n=1 Tax=Auricularia subglabra (strain TFB-10046 / SS5) TaxID=717982 RepID=J0CV39_AURST|nr:P-loop containing nucleoside triphosphate hydrolase protein [Auricularia subglabra TFB-10046 SS5]
MAQTASPTRRDASRVPSADPDASPVPEQEPFRWTSPQGLALILKILLAWPIGFHPHEFLLQWSAHVLEGQHFIGITATGDGKSCMFYFALIVMIYYTTNGPSPCGRSWLKNPAAIIVLPVTAIEDDLAPKLNALRLNTIVLNAKTLAAGGRALWECAASATTRLVILSPEILTSARFYALLDGPFGRRVALLCLDEIHLLLTWGVAFRKAFRQIGLLRPRIAGHVQIIALTASLLPGKEVQDVCASLGLRVSELHFERRSNLRGNLVLQRHAMLSALNGPDFPELEWMVTHRLKAICFADTIGRAWRICCYLWSLLPPGRDRELGVRPYHALNPSEYNEDTRRLLSEHDGDVFVATTNALSVGVDIGSVDVVAIWGTPEDVNSIIQQLGRAGRGNDECTALGIIYLPKTGLETALAVVASGKDSDEMTYELASVLTAEDIEAILNKLYNNPPLLDCPCPKCKGRPISGRRHELKDGRAIEALAAEKERTSAADASSVKQKKWRGPTTKAEICLIPSKH